MAGLTLYTTLLFSYCNLYCALHNDDITLYKTFITASESAALSNIRALRNYFCGYLEIRGSLQYVKMVWLKEESSVQTIFMKESLIVLSLSHLVSMVSYMYRCDHLALLTEQ